MRVARRSILVLLMGMMLAAVTSSPAVAGKNSNATGSYTVTVSPDGPYYFGEQIWVTTNDPIYPNGRGPYIWLKCYQNGQIVASGDHAAFPDGWYYNWPFTLGPTQIWTSGAADCTITVIHTRHNRIVVDATTSFHVRA
jgi:hypothetical protein